MVVITLTIATTISLSLTNIAIVSQGVFAQNTTTTTSAVLAEKRRNKRVPEANKEKKSYDLFTSCMNSWYEYVNAWSNMYTEFLRSTSKMTESWLDSFSKFWSGQYKG
jgi:hypothetical protein